MNKKVIFINNPAATSGGALSILKQFIEEVLLNLNSNIIIYVFCNVDLSKYNCENIKIINNINIKRGIGRVVWDLYGLKRWSKSNNIKPDLLISLQNTAIYGFNNISQIVYLHQSIPYYKTKKWNFFKKEERIYWFYRYIYKKIIDFSIKNNYVIVQTEWMKKSIVCDHRLNKEKVEVVRPSFKIKNTNLTKKIDKNILLYPASGDIYKNHMVLIEALNLLVNNKGLKNLKLCLTVDKDDIVDKYVLKKISEYKLEENIKFLGRLNLKILNEYYSRANIVLFPSYIETVGLPLIEAASLNKKIICSNLEYTREVLNGYNGVKYVNYDDYEMWSESIFDTINNSEESNLKVNFDNNGWYRMIEILNFILYGELNEK